MPEEHGWVWIERLFKKAPIPYPIFSLIIGVIIYLIFVFFSSKVVFFPWEFYHILEVSVLSLLIAFQLAGIQYLMNRMKKTFSRINFTAGSEAINELNSGLRQKFSSLRRYYLIIGFILVPFFINDLRRILWEGNTFYHVEPTLWSFLLDIFNISTSYFSLFLMATILLIISNIEWVLSELRSERYKNLIEIDFLNIDKIGGLKPIRDFVLIVLIFYFICITLAIMSYISPFRILSYESIFLIILLLVGAGFFIRGLQTVRIIFRRRIEDEINRINEKYQQERQRLMEILSKGNYKEKGDELSIVSTSLETLYTERERMLALYNNAKGYDSMTIVEFISSFILPLGAYIQKLFDIGIEIKKYL